MAPNELPARRRASVRKRASAVSTSRSDAKISATSSSTATSTTAAQYRGATALALSAVIHATRDDAAVAHVEGLGDGHGRLVRRVAQVLDDRALAVGDDGGRLVAQPGQARV